MKKQGKKIKNIKEKFSQSLHKLIAAADLYEDFMSDTWDIGLAVSKNNEAVINLYDPDCDIHSSYRLKDQIKDILESGLDEDEKIKHITVWLREMLSGCIKLDKALKKIGAECVDVEVEKL